MPNRTRWTDEIDWLDPETDYSRIVYLLGCCEFAWDIERSLEFALFRTYAVPGISALLSRTGEFRDRTRKRYDDSELLLSEIAENGTRSARGERAIRRMNEMHGRFRIPNDRMLYVLSTFVVEPKRWLDRFGKRPLTDREIAATVRHYGEMGRMMGISDIPESFAEFDGLNRAYEAEHFAYSDTNAEIAGLTRDLLLSFYLPRRLIAPCRPLVHALCDPPLRRAMGFPDPPRWLEHTVLRAMTLRAAILRHLPARRRPRLVTARRRPSYPGGYVIEDLGTFAPGRGPTATPADRHRDELPAGSP